MVSASTWVGFVLPGMMLLDRPSAGTVSSESPDIGPLPSSRMSLPHLLSDTASTFSAPCSSTKTSCAAMPSPGRSCGRYCRPVRRCSSMQKCRAKSGWVLRPEPAAVPPCGSTSSRGSTSRSRAMPSSTWRAQTRNSLPSVTGTASIMWVRPSLTTCAHSTARADSEARSVSSAGSSRPVTASAAAMCITLGKLSFEDCPRFTWSFGCTGWRDPSGEPSSWLARLDSTSLAFMLVCVPLPVCQIGSGKSASRLPAITSSAAVMMACASAAGSRPSVQLARAAAHFCKPTARITPGENRSVPMRNSSRARSVCGPHSRSASISMLPRLSVSVRVMAPGAR